MPENSDGIVDDIQLTSSIIKTEQETLDGRRVACLLFSCFICCFNTFPHGRVFFIEQCTCPWNTGWTELSTFLWWTESCWRWWHPFCLLGENRWAALAEKFHTKCKYSTLLFLCLRLFWPFLLFPSALKEHTPHWWMKTMMAILVSFYFSFIFTLWAYKQIYFMRTCCPSYFSSG